MRPMIAAEITSLLTKGVLKNRSWALTLGIGGFLIWGGLALFSWRESQEYAKGPALMTLHETLQSSKHERVYIRLTDTASPSCDQPIMYAKTASLPLQSIDGKITVLASYKSLGRCQELAGKPLEGVLEPIFYRKELELLKDGIPLAPNARDLCTSCGSGNSRTGIFVCGFLALMSLALIPIARAARKKAKAEARPEKTYQES